KGGAGADTLNLTVTGNVPSDDTDTNTNRVSTDGIETVNFDNTGSTAATTWTLSGGAVQFANNPTPLLTTAGAVKRRLSFGTGVNTVNVGDIGNETDLEMNLASANNAVNVGYAGHPVSGIAAPLVIAGTDTDTLKVDDSANLFGTGDVANGYRAR